MPALMRSSSLCTWPACALEAASSRRSSAVAASCCSCCSSEVGGGHEGADARARYGEMDENDSKVR